MMISCITGEHCIGIGFMRKVTKWHILIIGLIFLTLSLLFLWLGLDLSRSDKILAVFASVLSAAISGLFIVLFAYSFGKKHNVFLYDKKSKKEINVEDLTFEKVCEFLDLYIGLVFHGKDNISISDFIEGEIFDKVSGYYRPLIVMRLLLIWIETDSKDKWKQFTQTDKIYIDAIEDILSNCGENIISSRLQYLRASEDDSEIESFFLGKVEYLKAYILNYVKANIHNFE